VDFCYNSRMDDRNAIEIAKEAVKQIAKPVQDFIGAVLGKPANELGEWISDGIRGKRFETQLKIFTKAKQLTEDSGLEPSAINLKVLVPLLENGSLEDDESIIDMWAHLLANASTSDDVRASYIAILKELEPAEAKIMQYIYNEFVKKYGNDFAPTNEYAGSMKGAVIRELFGLSNQDFEQSIDNLYRLRLLAPTASRLEFLDNKEIPFAHYSKMTLGVTYLGYYFARACNKGP